VSSIRERIRELLSQINQLSVVETEIIRAENSAKVIDQNIREKLEMLEKKNLEIERLQSFSLTGLISSVFVDKKFELENKRNEYFQLSRQYDQIKAEKSASIFEMEILNRKMNELGVMKQELLVLMENRENELVNENSSQGMALLNVQKDIEEANIKLQKLNRSLELLDRIFSSLTLFSAALRDVESNISWNRKKQFMAGNSKETAIKKAKEFNVESRLMLNDLGKMLRELGISYTNLDVVLVAFENEFGIFFDNFISDIIMKKRIIEGVENVEFVFQNLKPVKEKITDKVSETDLLRQRLNSVKNKILTE
jgi:hypothetical protein